MGAFVGSPRAIGRATMIMALNSALMCRQQEALHRQRAAETPLAQVRAVALRAAMAWRHQAVEAADIEAGVGHVLSAEDAAIALEFLIEDAADPEEPDDHVRCQRRRRRRPRSEYGRLITGQGRLDGPS